MSCKNYVEYIIDKNEMIYIDTSTLMNVELHIPVKRHACSDFNGTLFSELTAHDSDKTAHYYQ